MKTLKLFAVFVVLAFLSTTCSAAVYVKWDSPNNGPGDDWDHAYHSVQAGINASLAGEEVWVAAGTYSERIVLKNWLALYGGFAGGEVWRNEREWKANETILDGNQAGSVVAGTNVISTIDGFTLRNGKSIAYSGGGISCSKGNLTVRNCIISNNTTMYGDGGGVYCTESTLTLANNTICDNTGRQGAGVYADHSSISVTNSTIKRNTTGAGSSAQGGGCYIRYCSSVTIQGNKIEGNEAEHGGGIFSEESSPLIKANLFAGNIGGAASCAYGSAVITNNRFAGNTARYGAIISLSEFGRLKNNVIVGNAACYEIIWCSDQAVVSNNTMIGNNAGYCGTIYCGSGSPVVANNVVAFNSAGIGKYPTATPILRNNCLFNEDWDYFGLPPGAGDFRADPGLASVKYGNVHLQPGSPCIDAGDNSVADPADKDMDGQSRIVNTVDIGADESDGTTWPDQPAIVRVSTDGDDANDGSSWSTAKKTIQAGIESASLAGGEVWVKAGAYNEVISVFPYAELYGGFDGTETERPQRNWRANEVIVQPPGQTCAVRAVGGRESLVIDGLMIRNGQSPRGGGIKSYFSSPTIANCSILSNTAAMAAGDYSSGAGGGIYCWYSSPSVSNCLIAGNTAVRGGGIYCEFSSSPKCTNCTIVANNAGDGGGVYSDRYYTPPWSSIAVLNSIIAFNQSGIHASSSSSVRYSNVFGNASYNYRGGVSLGTGSLYGNPLFIGTNDYHLQANSRCIDAGEDLAVLPGWLDLDCNPRIQGLAVDMGAFEYVPVHITIDVLPDRSPNDIVLQPNRLIAVAILGSASFDASQVDPLSVVFGPGRATEVHQKGHMEDANLDGLTDMVLHFRCGDTGIQPGDSTVFLRGQLTIGEQIEGSDVITASAT